MRFLCVLIALATPAAVQAQTVNWLSGVGDDVNPCSRTAPCLTPNAALAQGANVINIIDPDGKPAALHTSITSSVIVDGTYARRGALGAGVITINAGNNDVVVLRHLAFQGFGTAATAVTVQNAGAVFVEDCSVENYTNVGIEVNSTHPVSLYIQGLRARNIGNSALLLRSDNGGTVHGVARDVSIEHSQSGAVVAVGPTQFTLADSTLSNNAIGVVGTIGNGLPYILDGSAPDVTLSNVLVSHNALAFDLTAANQTVLRLHGSTVLDNTALTHSVGGATVASFATNHIVDDANFCAAVGGITPSTLDLGLTTPVSQTLQLPNAWPGIVHFTVVAGSLPSGVALQGSTLVGNPNAPGTYPFALLAVDAYGCTRQQVYNADLQSPCDQQLRDMAPLVALAPYASPLTFTASVVAPGAVTYGVVAGALPDGIALQGNYLSGIAPAPGDYNFTLQGNDTWGCGFTRTYSGSVVADCNLTLSPNTLAFTLNANVQTPLISNDTNPNATISLAGALPSGVALQGNQLTGTVTAVGDYNFTLTQTDDFGCQAAYAFVGTVPTPDFAVALSPNSITVSPGNTTLSHVTLTSVNGTFTAPIALSCDNANQITCNFSRTPVDISQGNATVSVTVTSTAATLAHRARTAGWDLAFGMVMGAGLATRRKMRRLLLCLICLTGVSCTAAVDNTSSTPNTVTVTVRATAGDVTHTAPLTVTLPSG